MTLPADSAHSQHDLEQLWSWRSSTGNLSLSSSFSRPIDHSFIPSKILFSQGSGIIRFVLNLASVVCIKTPELNIFH